MVLGKLTPGNSPPPSEIYKRERERGHFIKGAVFLRGIGVFSKGTIFLGQFSQEAVFLGGCFPGSVLMGVGAVHSKGGQFSRG